MDACCYAAAIKAATKLAIHAPAGSSIGDAAEKFLTGEFDRWAAHEGDLHDEDEGAAERDGEDPDA